MKKILLASALLFAISFGYAENFKIAFEPWQPYGDGSDAKNPKGITVDFYRQVFQSLGHTVEFIPMPAVRCIEELANSNVDGSLYTEAIDGKAVVVTTSVNYWLFAAIIPKSNPLAKFNSIGDFAGKTVGITRSYEYPEALNGFKGMKQEEVSDPIINLKKVAAGRIDVMFDDPVWAEIEAKNNAIEVRTLLPLVAADPTYLALGIKHKSLVAGIDAASKKLIKDGVLESLYKKYMGMSLADFKKKYGIQ